MDLPLMDPSRPFRTCPFVQAQSAHRLPMESTLPPGRSFQSAHSIRFLFASQELFSRTFRTTVSAAETRQGLQSSRGSRRSRLDAFSTPTLQQRGAVLAQVTCIANHRVGDALVQQAMPLNQVVLRGI
jgi:hypothetical protein